MHRSLDIYDLETGRKRYQDIVLPEGATVLGGGEALTVLMSTPPDPWVLHRYVLR